MNDTELENRIKKSADEINVKDFSAHYANICEIAGKEEEPLNAAILANRPVTQTTAGSSTGRGVKIAVISVICAFAVVLAAVLAVVIYSLTVGYGASSPVTDGASSQDANVYGGSTGTENDEVIISSISADQSSFYAAFDEAQIAVADFTIYDNVSYYLYYTEGTLAGGYVQFGYKNYSVRVELYLEEYILYFPSTTYENDGIYYLIKGDLTDEIEQEIAGNLY